jgi:hypothetical protein
MYQRSLQSFICHCAGNGNTVVGLVVNLLVGIRVKEKIP